MLVVTEKLLERTLDQFSVACDLKDHFLNSEQANRLVKMAETTAQSIAMGGKLLLCGNGGSAADAQHLAAELVVRLRSHLNRRAIPALSLVLDTSTLTACANDYGYDHVFERSLQALGRSGDVLLGLTTSGRSKNVLLALEEAQKMRCITMGFLGGDGGPALALCDQAIVVPSSDPNRIQELHITCGHILMDLIEHLICSG